jgi:hypothetical protein
MDLALEILLAGRDACVTKIHAANVPDVSIVRENRNGFLALTSGTLLVQRAPPRAAQAAERSTSEDLGRRVSAACSVRLYTGPSWG